MKRSICFLLLPILVTSAGCPTTDNNVGSLGNDSAVADGGTLTGSGGTGATGGTIAPDGGGGSDGGGGIPENHRISHDTCGLSSQPTSPCVAHGTSGTEFSNCSASSDCQSGTNGRCLPVTQVDGNACNCAYDNCFSDGDCSAGGPCICGDLQGGNSCLPGDCQVDADCGPQGYCSPSRGSYANFADRDSEKSWQGFYCHRYGDVCINDADCPPPPGWWGDYCAYDTTISAWACMRYYIQ
jgi:hypothetical protein